MAPAASTIVMVVPPKVVGRFGKSASTVVEAKPVSKAVASDSAASGPGNKLAAETTVSGAGGPEIFRNAATPVSDAAAATSGLPSRFRSVTARGPVLVNATGA